ncbi:MAG: MBL fold metallo-hydrolase [Pseudomonadota bacterium]
MKFRISSQETLKREDCLNMEHSRKYLVIIISILANLSCATSMYISKEDQQQTTTIRRAYANTHVVKLENENYIMIDSGGYEQAPLLEKDLLSEGIDPKDILAIVITHGHWDHAGGAKYFRDKYKIPVIAGWGDRKLFQKGHADKLCPTSMMARWRAMDDETVSFSPPEVDFWIREDTNLQDLIGVEGQLVPLPSHTEGSLAVIIGQQAFVGDLFRGSIFGNTPEVHFYICNLVSNRNYINQFLSRQASKVQSFFPGHFGPRFTRSEVTQAFINGNSIEP